MSYFAQDGALHGSWPSGRYVPAAKVTRVLCDACAEFEVEWVPSGDARTHLVQARPWKWAPWYGSACHCCGKNA